MKKISIILISAAILLSPFLIARAQVSITLWKVLGGILQPVLSSWQVQIPSLGSSGSPCLTVNPAGLLATTTCGSVGEPLYTAWYNGGNATLSSLTVNNLFPSVDNTYSIGTALYRYKNLFLSGNATTSKLTITSVASSFLATDANGNVISTTTDRKSVV